MSFGSKYAKHISDRLIELVLGEGRHRLFTHAGPVEIQKTHYINKYVLVNLKSTDCI